MLSLLLGRCARLGPGALLKVDLVPRQAQDLAPTRAGEQQQPDGIRDVLVWISSQCFSQPIQLTVGEIAFALGLGVFLRRLHGLPLCSLRIF